MTPFGYFLIDIDTEMQWDNLLLLSIMELGTAACAEEYHCTYIQVSKILDETNSFSSHVLKWKDK